MIETAAERKQCFGGVARLKKEVDALKEEHDNVLFVNAGDFYQGTVWYSRFKWKVVAKFANMLNFTAMVCINIKRLVDLFVGVSNFCIKTNIPKGNFYTL